MWLGAVADSGKVTSGTIAMYKAALSTEYVERATRGAYEGVIVNPMDDIRVTRFMSGVKNAFAVSDRSKREARPRTEAMTFARLDIMSKVFITPASLVEHTRVMAASHLALAAGLRPSELLGSSLYKDRALTLDQLVFYLTEDGSHPAAHAPPKTDHRYIRTPRPITYQLMAGAPNHVTLELYVSKTNQRRQSSFTFVGQAATVEWLWKWRKMRGDDEDTSSDLFHHPCLPRLTTQRLIKLLTAVTAATKLDPMYITGKCFRIGAASALAAQGISATDISVNNRWSTKTNTWERYADRTAHQQRALKINRSMA